MRNAEAVLQGLYTHLAGASWQITILVVLVLLVSVFARKASPAFRYGLWCVVLLRLCIPVSVTLPLGMSADFRGALQQVVQPVVRPTGQPENVTRETGLTTVERARQNDLAQASAGGTATVSTVTAQPFPWRTVLVGGWLGTSALLAALVILWTIRHGRIVNRLPAVQRPELQSLLERLRGELGVRRPVRLCETGDVLPEVGPMVFGVRKPTIVLPHRMAHEWAQEDIEPLLAHELAHVRRNDLLVNWVQVGLQVVWFFHPLVWYANWRIRREREWACDDMAVSHIGNRSRAYCERILRVLEETDRNLTLAMAGAGMAERHNSLSERIMRIMNRNYKPSRRTGMLAVTIVVVIGVACLALASDRLVSTPDDGLDTATRTLGEETHKRITTYTDEAEYTLRDGGNAVMAIKPNAAGVEKLRITVGLNGDVTSVSLMALGKDNKELSDKPTVVSIRPDSFMNTGVAVRNARDQMVKVNLTPKVDGDTVKLKVRSLVTKMPTPEELEAALKVRGKEGKWALDMQEINKAIMAYKLKNGRYPENLLLLGRTLPTDVYSPSGQSYGYEPGERRYILTSCGEDRIAGNEDDQVMVVERSRSFSGTRREILPPGPELADKQVERTGPSGRRPRGNCLLAGTVVSDRTGKPVAGATLYLHLRETLDAIFIETGGDGTFEFRDIPSGSLSLKVINTARYRPEAYNPDNSNGDFPPFNLKDGEQRSDIVLRLKSSYRISGKILNEEGKPPSGRFSVKAWFEKSDDGGMARYKSTEQGFVQPDGTYFIDGLDGQSVYVWVEESRGYKSDKPYPPRYWPGTFSREEARKVEFGDAASVDNIDIKLVRTGGLVLEGKVTQAGADTPVPDVLVVVYHKDMLFDRVLGYTDAAGKYHIEGLGPGVVQVQVDASPEGLVRTCRELDLKAGAAATNLDVTLNRGATISGRIVDEAGKDLPIVSINTFGHARPKDKHPDRGGAFSGLPNRKSAATVGSPGVITYTFATGDAVEAEMLYPTANKFLVEAVQPGDIVLNPMLYAKGAKVMKILHGGRDVTTDGIRVGAGDRISDVRIVVAQDGSTTATQSKGPAGR